MNPDAITPSTLQSLGVVSMDITWVLAAENTSSVTTTE